MLSAGLLYFNCVCLFWSDGLGCSECLSVLENIRVVLQRSAVLLSTRDAGGKNRVYVSSLKCVCVLKSGMCYSCVRVEIEHF